MVTAALVLLAGALLLAGHLRDDAYLVAVALGLSLAAVVVESVQVLRARRTAPAVVEAGTDETSGTPPAVEQPGPEPVETTPAPSEVEPAETPDASEPEPPAPDSAAESVPAPAPVRLPGRTTYHRPECPTVRGKTVVPIEPEVEPDEVLKPCGRCRPAPLRETGESG